MAQREMNNKTIRHYCQPGKLIYYIFNSQRGILTNISCTHARGIFLGSKFSDLLFLGCTKFWWFFFGVLEILVLLWGNFDKNAYFDIFFAYLKPKFGTRNCMRSYFLEFIFSTGIFLGAFENFVIFWG